jgi:predicted DNA-binding protein (MmcQ/YjbR family)
MTVDLGEIKTYCLAKPGTTAEHPFGPDALVIKVAGKMFAIVLEKADPLTISLKCEPEIAILLRETHDAVAPGYHLNKKHWNTVTLDGTVSDALVREWTDDSYDLVFESLPRRVREEIGPN